MTTRPRPWSAHRVHGAYQIEDANGDYVCVIPVVGPDDLDARDDAELIAGAVNALEHVKVFLDALRLESGIGHVLLPMERMAFEQIDAEVSGLLNVEVTL